MSELQYGDYSRLPGESMVPIRTVSSLTGVNPVTLRAWERRYGLIQPTRTPKGHRLYSMADVERINQVVALLEGGMSIGQVQQVLDRHPPEDAPRRRELEPADTIVEQPRYELWQSYQNRMLEAIQVFDEAALNETYNEILALYPIDVVTQRLIVPLLRELGLRWEQGRETGVAEEHFFSVFLRNKLGARLHHYNRRREGPLLLAACLPGEQHDVGLLLFTLVALDWNYRIVMLGANTPLDELTRVARRIECRGIVLASSERPVDTVMDDALPGLVRAVPVPVFIGGRITERHTRELTGIGLVVLQDDFQLALRAINQQLRRGA